MARCKQFDQQAALEKAMETFWRYGYEGTSITTLLNNMGINRGSLYDTFGGKRSLFESALALYEETVLATIVKPLEAPNAAKQAICDRFNEIVDQAVADVQRRGCLITNSAVELASHDPEIQQQIARTFQQVQEAFQKALLRSQQQGEISPKLDREAIAAFLTSSLQGLRVMSRVNPDPEEMRKVVRVTLSVLQ
ncbi:TetR/AcrR family transcriptional regulator [Geitlerinema sp. PCC 9228]|jgi:TetR/AcrR family transcriptional repressor of nem operon|uniref:TetR/AcrR family transcriptional regulator n=1 Tax=Geitlerinema sp. PCC 9228 TaxID=111611 RepID=UPI0008F9D3B5|nr:TetR/AcrR family transcriptional regulator [Geitlerinema sp. PCC 9228]